MRIKSIIGILALVGIASTAAQAQEKLKMEVGYNLSVPTGSFKTNEVNNTSYRGAFGEISYRINPLFSLGLNVGYQNYYQKYDRKLYKTNDGQTVSAVRTNAIDVMPLLLRGTYFPMGVTTSKIQPYLSAGAGLNFVNYNQYLGEFGSPITAMPLAAQAGAGIVIPVGGGKYNDTNFKLGATYNYSGFTADNVNTKLGNVGVNAGIVFPIK